MQLGSNEREGLKSFLLTVDAVLNIGYALHVADDPTLNDKSTGLPNHTKQQAQRVANEFLALQSSLDPKEAMWLLQARAVAVSLGKAITRRKDTWEKRLAAAQAKRSYQLQRMYDSRRSSDSLSLFWKLLGQGLLALSGYLLAQLIAPFVPEAIGTQTGSRVPAVVAGLAFLFLGRAVSYWLIDIRRNNVETEYRNQCFQADLAYELGKMREFKMQRATLCDIWLRCTSETYPETATYQWVMEGDVATRRELEKQHQLYDKTPLWYVGKLLSSLGSKKKKGLGSNYRRLFYSPKPQ